MQKTFFWGMILLLSLFSCQSEMEEVKSVSDPFSSAAQMELDQKLTFSGNQEIEAILKEKDTRSVKAFPSGFVALTSPIAMGDSLLNSLSPSEKESVLNSKESYYNLLGYSQYVPNEKLAGLLNSRGEIIVGDTLYRVTPVGVFFSHKEQEKELDSVVSHTAYEELSFREKGEVKRLSENVLLRNTIDYSNVEEATYQNRETRTSVDAIPFSSFPVFGHKNITVAGKIIAGVFGPRSVKHHEFRDKHRVAGSLYDYDYGFYHEIGTYVELERKRGGFFSWINGWESINAQEMVISYKNLVIEIDYKLPDPRTMDFPEKQTVPNPVASALENGKYVVGGANMLTFIADEPILTLDILSLNVTKKDVQRLIAYVAEASFHELRRELGDPIPESVKAIRVLSPGKSYYAIANATLNKHNCKEYRKVFDSGVRFLISYSNKGLGASVAQMWKLREKMPMSNLISGEVQLAAKYENQWGGMTIFVKQ